MWAGVREASRRRWSEGFESTGFFILMTFEHISVEQLELIPTPRGKADGPQCVNDFVKCQDIS